MVEITYQMVLSTIQTIGILIGIYYYIMTLRNQNRTRQEQWLLQLYHSKADHEAMQRFFKYMEASWDDYEDYCARAVPGQISRAETSVGCMAVSQ